ncbi:hypothetical protein K3X48_15245 (plasmid) [Aliiroseovarius crassostreae]|uniref:Uncharacterized protein n=1 Tax=Aliiroseovarius crassostreae TaxID=154981 RepID=A0A9Q9HFK9_9RHOB|nr:DUF6572 domain-containing protein [Aliiroseovarius crassostreae]UWP97184.1 hypothetical protein K3X48_15245 [Aliiroseovarius crassostreae]
MTISETDTIDFVQVNASDQRVNLIVADHLPWEGIGDADDQHMYLLQEKLNSYLAYVETRQLYSDYPDVVGYDIKLQVYGKFDRSPKGVEFYARLRGFLEQSGYSIEFILKS